MGPYDITTGEKHWFLELADYEGKTHPSATDVAVLRLRSKKLRNDSSECICCDGKHVFCHSTEPSNIRDWLSQKFYEMEDGKMYEIVVRAVQED